MKHKPKAQVFLRTPYNYDMHEASRLSGLSCSDPTRTQQNFKEECDINTIVRNFGVTGEMPLTTATPLQGDFADAATDYQSALNLILQADQSFMELPSDVRKRFNNDPGAFVEFASDPANRDEVEKMGLGRPKPAAPAPLAVRVIPDNPPENQPAKTP